jgi:tetratricopeptide (TPR) repeat protein
VRVGASLRAGGRHTEAREHINDALVVLRENPDAATVDALLQLSNLAVGNPDADRFSAEACALADQVDTPIALVAAVFNDRALNILSLGRRREGVMYLREAARLADLAGDSYAYGLALSNIANAVRHDDPVEAAETAREAVAVGRRGGSHRVLGLAIENLASALIVLGDWDGAASLLDEAIEQDGLGEHDYVVAITALFAALRGDSETARSMLERLGHWRSSTEDPNERASVPLIEAQVAFAEQRYALAVQKAKESLEFVWRGLVTIDDLGELAWPLAVHAAFAASDDVAADALIERLDTLNEAQLPRLLRAERRLAHAQRAARHTDPSADEQFEAAIADQRKWSTPYHLAHGLLDYAEHLIATGGSERAAPLIEEATAIADRLKAQPLAARAAAVAATAEVRSPV